MGVAKKKRTRKKVRQTVKKRPTVPSALPQKAKELWDPKKTLTENYKTIGINFEYNTIKDDDLKKFEEYAEVDLDEQAEQEKREKEESEKVSKKKKKKAEKEKTVFDELFPTPEPPAPKEPKLTAAEKVYFKKLMDKFGTDYRKMGRDFKSNYYQHTEKFCKKKCELLLKKQQNDQQQ